MAQVGQTTPTGGREWALNLGLAAAREITIPDNCTLNHLGVYVREQLTANANDLVACICTPAGVRVATSQVLSNAIASTATFDWEQIPFSGEFVAAGNYVIFAMGSAEDGNIVLQGQTDVSGVVSYLAFDPEITFPTIPDDLADELRSDATRSWDMYLDYTPVINPALSAPTPSGTIGTTTTATIGATTDQATGTFYVVVDSGANLAGVTAVQIKAGQRADGNAALASNDAAVGSTSPSAGVTGLVAGTSYAYAAIQNNANGDSNIVTGTFTTASGTATSRPGSGGSRSRVATLMLS
jgi:hypothetical protein